MPDYAKLAEVKRLHQRRGDTIIDVTPDQIEAMTLPDRIVVMNHGRTEQQGTPAEMFHDPETEARIR
ncbi:hypothetical protein [Jannaschia sp. S6380]|uniref:hypothetical protein n=1 Tax=Jannaschia sp. S6380 TaxID=2926408 RepID=UPI0032B2CD6D